MSADNAIAILDCEDGTWKVSMVFMSGIYKSDFFSEDMKARGWIKTFNSEQDALMAAWKWLDEEMVVEYGIISLTLDDLQDDPEVCPKCGQEMWDQCGWCLYEGWQSV